MKGCRASGDVAEPSPEFFEFTPDDYHKVMAGEHKLPHMCCISGVPACPAHSWLLPCSLLHLDAWPSFQQAVGSSFGAVEEHSRPKAAYKVVKLSNASSML